MSKTLSHLKTIYNHRKQVRKICFKMGIGWQGLWHDLSTYSPIEMPYKYVIKMFCDRVGACHEYQGKNFIKESAWEYFETEDPDHKLIESRSTYLLAKLLWNLHEAESEKAFFKWYKKIKSWLKEQYNNNNVDY